MSFCGRTWRGFGTSVPAQGGPSQPQFSACPLPPRVRPTHPVASLQCPLPSVLPQECGAGRGKRLDAGFYAGRTSVETEPERKARETRPALDNALEDLPQPQPGARVWSRTPDLTPERSDVAGGRRAQRPCQCHCRQTTLRPKRDARGVWRPCVSFVVLSPHLLLPTDP